MVLQGNLGSAILEGLVFPRHVTDEYAIGCWISIIIGASAYYSLRKSAGDRRFIQCDSCGHKYSRGRWVAHRGCLSCGSDAGSYA